MAANSPGAGLTVNLTAAQLDQDFGSDIATFRNALARFQQRYNTYWSPFGTDATFGYQALKTAAGDPNAATDFANMATAVALMVKLNQIVLGNATVAVDSENGGNGTVTVGPNGSGFNFDQFLVRVCGDSVA